MEWTLNYTIEAQFKIFQILQIDPDFYKWLESNNHTHVVRVVSDKLRPNRCRIYRDYLEISSHPSFPECSPHSNIDTSIEQFNEAIKERISCWLDWKKNNVKTIETLKTQKFGL